MIRSTGSAGSEIIASAEAAPVYMAMPQPPPPEVDLENNTAFLVVPVGAKAVGMPSLSWAGLLVLGLPILGAARVRWRE